MEYRFPSGGYHYPTFEHRGLGVLNNIIMFPEFRFCASRNLYACINSKILSLEGTSNESKAIAVISIYQNRRIIIFGRFDWLPAYNSDYL